MASARPQAPPRSATPVRELRDAFGDPKPPDISRKITACVACRKQKIKCHMVGSQPPCARCKKKGLPCNVNRSLQMLLESDVVWKQAMEQKIQKIETAIRTIVKNVPNSEALQQIQQDLEDKSPSTDEPNSEDHQQDQRTINEQANHQSQWRIGIDLDLESAPGNLPGHYLFQTTPTRSKTHTDIISRGIISLESAQTYFDEYQNRLDHFLYRILGEHSAVTLDRIRVASPLLTTAICAVGALHLNSQDFDPCYEEFLALTSTQSFHKSSTLDDVRALCIGAFWLSDMSWPLVGNAVQIATELQLHKGFFKALQGDRGHYLRIRLYFLVYACDHHFSVAYGRPPMTRECEAVRNARDFLDCEHATEDDGRLVSQVLRWSICSNIYDTFGADVDRPLSDFEVPHVRRFSIALDSLRAEWADKFGSSSNIGNYANKGIGLQYHFAKLYLCSHALRGAGTSQTKSRSPDVALELDDIANSAVLSAVSILRAVVSDTEIQSYLNGLPIYFDIMIAFAVVFLLKVSTQFSASLQLDVKEIQRITSTLVTVLKRVTATMHPRHLLVNITKGIDGLLQRCGMVTDLDISGTATSPKRMDALPQHVPQDALHEFNMLNNDVPQATDEIFDQYCMSGYDFLWKQDNVLQPWNFPSENSFQTF